MPDVSVKGLLIHIVRAIGADALIMAVSDVLYTLAEDSNEKFKDQLREAGASLIKAGVILEKRHEQPMTGTPSKNSRLPIVG